MLNHCDMQQGFAIISSNRNYSNSSSLVERKCTHASKKIKKNTCPFLISLKATELLESMMLNTRRMQTSTYSKFFKK